MSDSVPPKGQRDAEVDCIAPMVTAGLGKPSTPGTTWLRAGLAVPG
jgi:hypothetical protein